jgi:hypothetical protein
MPFTIEITPGLIAMSLGWVSSSLTAAWVLSRRSKQWDEIEDAVTVLFGDRKTGQKGLAQRFDDLVADVDEDAARLRGALKALHANHPTEAEVEQAVRHTLNEHRRAGMNGQSPPTL